VPDVTLGAFKSANSLPFTFKVPDVLFDAFKLVNAKPELTKLVADKVLVVFFHMKLVADKVLVVLFLVKLADCEKLNGPLPIKI
jgi:hypothetical protein